MGLTPPSGTAWVGLCASPLPVERAIEWATLPTCGAVVTFMGTVRDHAEGRDGVARLDYEAWEEQVAGVLADVAAEARNRWPDLGRVAVLHRSGSLEVGQIAVVVVASSPHRDSAFAAARFLIDATKSRAPIWKKEYWSDGEAWVEGELVPAGEPG